MAVSSASASGARMRAVGAFTMVNECVRYAGWARGEAADGTLGGADGEVLAVLDFIRVPATGALAVQSMVGGGFRAAWVLLVQCFRGGWKGSK